MDQRVEEVHIPARVTSIDPKLVSDKHDDVAALKSEVDKARARRELVQEMKLTESIENPQTPDPPFKITGGVNLGTIDLQEEQRKARELAEQSRRDADARIVKLEEERNNANKALHDAELAHTRQELSGQIESLKRSIEHNGKAPDLFDQLAAIEQLAGKLGFQKPAPGSSDGIMSVELKKLDMLMGQQQRDFDMKMKQDERMWQLEIKKLEMQAVDASQRLQAEKDKAKFWTEGIERLGGAIAQGMIEYGKGGEVVSEEPPAAAAVRPSPPVTQTDPAKTYTAEADPGEAGSFPCPTCKTPIGFGPDTKLAKCVKCQSQVQIDRIPSTPDPSPAPKA